MEKSVYVLTESFMCVDSGDCYHRVIGVYETFGQAQSVMEKEMVEIRKDFDYCDTEENEYVEGDMCWSIWEKHEGMSHYCDLKITAIDVEAE